MTRFVFLIVLGALLFAAGCATTGGNPGAIVDNTGDGIIKQRVEFKDLPAWEQQVIVQGGGGE